MTTPAPAAPAGGVPEDSLARFNIGPPECRKMALATKYEKLNVPPEQLTAAENDVRAAKMYEVYRMNKFMKQSEMEERRRMLLGEEHIRSEEEHRLTVMYQQLRKKALMQYQKELTAAQMTQQQLLESDNKFVVDREKSLLLHKRREFEDKFGAEMSGSPMPPNVDALAFESMMQDPPALIMTIDIGNGHTDNLEVYLDDDPWQLSSTFCAKHSLHDDMISILARQIQDQIGQAKV
eukprot:PhF_6_TR13221/c0_g1_i2/m.20906